MTLFANPAGGNLVLEPDAMFVSRGHNLFSDTPSVTLDSTDLVNTDPLLGPLADNGGPTQTVALLARQPGHRRRGSPLPGVITDQRGIPRPQGIAPDIGAFESRGFTLTIVGGNQQQTPGRLGLSRVAGRAVTSPFGEPVAGGLVTFSAPASGPSAKLDVPVVPLDGNGRASVNATANEVAGTYMVSARVAGVTSVAFDLTNAGIPTVVGLERRGVHLQSDHDCRDLQRTDGRRSPPAGPNTA